MGSTPRWVLVMCWLGKYPRHFGNVPTTGLVSLCVSLVSSPMTTIVARRGPELKHLRHMTTACRWSAIRLNWVFNGCPGMPRFPIFHLNGPMGPTRVEGTASSYPHLHNRA